MLGSWSEKHHTKMFVRARQFIETNVYHLIPWAWSAAWLLTGAGVWLSDIYSYPSKSLIAYITLSALGWGTAGVITVSATREKPGMAVRLAAWVVAYLAAIVLGWIWMRSWNMGFFGPIVAIGVAGAIGGVVTSLRSGVWQLVSGALLGVVFLILATFSFYASYILLLVYTGIAQRHGDIAILYGFSWILPGALFGLGAGFAVRWVLGIQPVDSTSASS